MDPPDGCKWDPWGCESHHLQAGSLSPVVDKMSSVVPDKGAGTHIPEGLFFFYDPMVAVRWAINTAS